MLQYNGVTFPFCLTETHSSEPVPDPSGTDVLYTKTTISVRGVLRAGDFPAVGAETLPQTIDRITHLLTTPRRSLTYSVGATTMIAVPQVDDANGPMPDAGAFRIEPLEGSFVVHFTVSTWLKRCTAASARGFLSLKWSDQETDDLRGTKTRRRSGLLVVSRGFTPNADDRRNLVIPLVPPGFRRGSADYTLSEDGLRLRFTFVDQQLHKAVPSPAVKVSGSMAETTPKSGIGPRRGELNVRLEGRPGTDVRLLLDAALRIGMGRVYASNPQRAKEGGGILIGGGVRESLNDDETAVELSLAWVIHPTAARLAAGPQTTQLTGGGGFTAGVLGSLGPAGAGIGAAAGVFAGGRGALQNQTPEGRPMAALAGDFAWLGQDFPGADLAQGVPSTTRGTGLAAALRPLAALLYDPCGVQGSLAQGPRPSEWVLTGASGTATVRAGPVAPSDEQAVYNDPLPGVWDCWHMKYTFTEDSGYGVVPATKPNAAGEAVRFGNPAKKLFVEWELQRTGGVPALPEVKVPRPGGWTGDGTHDDNWVGRKLSRCYPEPQVAADGVSFVYAAAGTMEWEALDPLKVGEAYPCPPWLAPAGRPTRTAVAQLAAAPADTRLTGPPQAPQQAGGGLAPGVLDFTIPGVPPPRA